ncbi:hypothetical protein MRB53_028900 [Persea americana]|uniref:Uncharacterized protein n=1 Tax=Persea americana TaxID=3435 RepID=A0ACC2KH12_PERAE|nr:hypothetical protein MRB53_028900 [Persea americana]
MGTEPRQYIGPITKATKCRQKKTKRIQRVPAAMGIPFCEGDAAAMGRDAAAMREERRRYDEHQPRCSSTALSPSNLGNASLPPSLQLEKIAAQEEAHCAYSEFEVT